MVDIESNTVGDNNLKSGNPQNVIRESKKFLRKASMIVKEAKHPYLMDGVKFVATSQKSLRPEEIAAQLLRHLKKDYAVQEVIIY